MTAKSRGGKQSKEVPPKEATVGASSAWYRLSRGWRPYACLLLLVAVVYGQILTFDLVGLDDAQQISRTESPIHSLAGALSAFHNTPYVDFYRPALIFSLYLSRVLGGNALPAYFLTNLLLHALACWLAFLLLLRLGHRRRAALLLSALLAVHPLLAQGVAWIMGRNDSLLAVFTLLSFWAFLALQESRGGRRWLYLLAHLTAFGLALFTKESAAALPLLCLASLSLLRREKIITPMMLPTAGGWALVAAGWLALRAQALSRVAEEQQRFASAFSLEAFAAGLPSILELFGKALLPVRLSVYATYSAGAAVLGLFALATVAFLLWSYRGWRTGSVVFGFSWFILFLAPSLFLHLPYAEGGYDYLEHRAYLSTFGLVLLLAEFLRAGVQRKGEAFAGPFLRWTTLVVVLFAAGTLVHARDFRNRLSFWANAVATSPASAKAHGMYAQTLLREPARAREAETHLRTALQLEMSQGGIPHLSYLHDLGAVYSLLGRHKEAYQYWRRVLDTPQAFPGEEHIYDEARVNLMLWHYQEKQLSEALEYYRQLKERGVEIEKQFPDVIRGLLGQTNRLQEFKGAP